MHTSQDRARRLAREVAAPFSVLLEGDVGAGKTTFSQFFINELQEGSQQLVTSPTF
ncbi:MAG: tRNA (adenosine(37)-N6)-threonylcarbamoyltransferase complex ATPase subunit type 1 TsaE, partial [Alphaproteobacteria bacterium]|nr:tRNA (adenosine(37)-N6)-threonylcarbamoyltransferase complex ATPase subunit type 1 TsaE [Alphaproteobacteria bacterium]